MILLVMVLSWVADHTSADDIRIATYNVHYDNFDSDQMVDAVRAADADLVCFQEANERTMGVIRARLADRYPFTSRDNQFGFASKTQPKQVELDSAKRFRAATFSISGRTIRVVNTHLTPIDLPKEPNLLQVMGALSSSEEAHLNET